jgi:hypothetical protein
MVTRGMKQIATLATFRLMGLAKIEEITADYIVFRANELATVVQAAGIADELTESYGIQVTVRF